MAGRVTEVVHRHGAGLRGGHRRADYKVTDNGNTASLGTCPGVFPTGTFVVVQTCALSQVATVLQNEDSSIWFRRVKII